MREFEGAGLYLVEFSRGESMEVPERLLEAVEAG
jgi:hypothetical protein